MEGRGHPRGEELELGKKCLDFVGTEKGYLMQVQYGEREREK